MQQVNTLKKAFFLCAFFTLPLLVVMVFRWFGITLFPFSRPYVQLALALPSLMFSLVMLLGEKGLSPARTVAFCAFFGFVFSLYTCFAAPDSFATYLPFSSALLTFLLLERLLHAAAISPDEEQKESVKTVLFQDGVGKITTPSSIVCGDVLKIRTGDAVPFDGILAEKQAVLDASSLCGQSRFQRKKSKDSILSGTENPGPPFLMRVQHMGENTTLARLRDEIKNASACKPPFQSITQKTAALLFPLLLALSSACIALWLFFHRSLTFSLTCGVSIFLVAGAYLLGLMFSSTLLQGKNKGFLHQRHHLLERLSQADTVVFDKTGTLTEGTLCVTEILPQGCSREALLCAAFALAQGEKHPILKTLCTFIEGQGICTTHAQSRHMGTLGMGGQVRKTDWLMGSRHFMLEKGIDLSSFEKQQKALEQRGKTLLYLAADHTFMGVITFSDPIKPKAKMTIDALKEAGLTPILLTGDDEASALCYAHALGIDEVACHLSPKDKADYINALQNQGNRVLMVGDGLNDGPALALSHVGISLASGAPENRQTADICMQWKDLSTLAALLRRARNFAKKLRFDRIRTFLYLLFTLPFAMLGLIRPVFMEWLLLITLATMLVHTLILKRIFQIKEDKV